MSTTGGGRPRLRRQPSLSEQIALDLRRRIRQQEWQPDEMIPSESSLARSYGVSHNTVREAIGRLANEGRLLVRHGVGTTVRGPSVRGHYDITRLHSIVDVTGEQGKDALVVLHRKIVRPGTELELERLGLPAFTKLFYVERTFVVDGWVVSFCYDRYPAGIFLQPLGDARWSDFLLDILESLGIYVASSAVETHAVASNDLGWGSDGRDEGLFIILEQRHFSEAMPMIFSETYDVERRYQLCLQTSR